jgi:hypothetical protein
LRQIDEPLARVASDVNVGAVSEQRGNGEATVFVGGWEVGLQNKGSHAEEGYEEEKVTDREVRDSHCRAREAIVEGPARKGLGAGGTGVVDDACLARATGLGGDGVS